MVESQFVNLLWRRCHKEVLHEVIIFLWHESGTVVKSHGVCDRRYIPYIGMVTIIMNDYPYAKYALISILGLFVVTSKD